LRLTSGVEARPASTPGRGVVSYDEAVYTCAAKDTWLALSQRFYQTPAYAAALQLYNRGHPQATRGMAAEGALTIGEPVFVPSTSVLHERHGTHIASTQGNGQP
jgi:hypothetical protein